MLSLQKVSKHFGKLKVVNDLSYELKSGEIIGLLGPNGAGKTTLIRMIMGLLRPSAGTIRLFDEYTPFDKAARRRIGYMPQQLAVYPGLTVRENILFFGRLYGMDQRALSQKTEEVLHFTELAEKQGELVQHLSGGMVRRTMMASALVHQPSLVILDEPTAGVDPILRIKFWEWFGRLAADGISILVTTHHISEAARCHRVLFLREGQLMEQGTPVELMDRYQTQDLEAAFVQATQSRNSERILP